MKPKNTTVKPSPSNEALLMKDAGKIGATMVHISFSALKLFAGMVKVAFRASKLIVDSTVRLAKKRDGQESTR